MECAIGKRTAAAATIRGTEPAAPDGDGFRSDMLDLVYTRVNRRDPRRMSLRYARLEDRSTLLMGRIAAVVDPEAGRMLDRLDAIQAVLAAMAMELAYQRGMADGMREGMGMIGVNQVTSHESRVAGRDARL